MDESRAAKLLGEAFRCAPVETDEAYEFTPRSRVGDLKVNITKAVLSSTVKELNAKSRYASLWLHDDKSMEILAREESPIPVRSLRGEELNFRDDDNGVSYEITAASDAYILFFLDAISEHSDARFFLRGYTSSMLERRLAEREDLPTVFELVLYQFLVDG
ncbi:MAG: hypothetical protein DCF22_08790 [Leptolyngbya sp.]|nr:MAG: hypothetical protein DCF22_08790 [Leptolyngbya sp.]